MGGENGGMKNIAGGYSLEKLRELMVGSFAYRNLPQSAKKNIELHIEYGNENVLRFVYMVLVEEATKVEAAFENVEKKIYEEVQKMTYQAMHSLKDKGK